MRPSLTDVDKAIMHLGMLLHDLRHLRDATERNDPAIESFRMAVARSTKRYLKAAEPFSASSCFTSASSLPPHTKPPTNH